MTDTIAASRADSVRPSNGGWLPRIAQSQATRLVFFTLGFGSASWAPLVPYAKARLSLDNHALGLLLLCLGSGALLAMPASGSLVHRFGCRIVVIWTSVVAAIALPVLALGSSFAVMVPALFAFGAALGAFGVAINIQAVIVERASGRAMMSGFHALYSVGGILGAAVMVGLLGLGLPVVVATLCASLVLLVALPVAAPGLLTDGGDGGGSILAIPRGIVILIGLLCFVMFLSEGAMLDWGAVFLSSADGMKASTAGLGYTVFAITMSAGRLSGDVLVTRFGRIRLIIGGAVCAALGFVVTTMAPTWPLALVGFAIIGAGCANVTPSLFTLTGRQTRMSGGNAISAASTLGYAGILLGPALIGFAAALTSLHTAFYGLAVALLLVAASARFLPR